MELFKGKKLRVKPEHVWCEHCPTECTITRIGGPPPEGLVNYRDHTGEYFVSSGAMQSENPGDDWFTVTEIEKYFNEV